MTNPDLDMLLRRIRATQDEEISCTECFDLVPVYVDLEIAGRLAEAPLPRLQQHLDQCSACREEYETLRDLVRLEAERRLPSVDELRRSF
ncbi:MAG TPA: hypothetical protein VNN07_03830 [Candidatus Tectomicrobia bacterium]|nr:hypothetical protein [Candidatus Tectomicrobia bacterium]